MQKPALALFLAVFLPLLATGPAAAQPGHAAEVFYLKFGQGASDLSGDAGAGSGIRDVVDLGRPSGDNLQYAFALEVGYRFSKSSSLGIGYQLGSYYRPAAGEMGAGSERRHTLHVLARRKVGVQRWRVVPYFDLGVNVSSGIKRFGVGPSAGAGLSVAVDNQMSIFLESRLNFVFPNQTADTDGLSWPRWLYSAFLSEDIPFDVLSSLPALGVEIDLH
jgi:hypothetical protein